MWILNQRRDKLINTDNVKQIRFFEDGEITADGTVLGKYGDPKPPFSAIMNALAMTTPVNVMVMPGEEDENG